jgi:hypothetical protein
LNHAIGAPRRDGSSALAQCCRQSGDEVVIHDLSATGILIETSADLATFEQLQLDLPEVGPRVATVIWSSGHYFGCEFQQPIPQAAISAALLQSPFRQPVGGVVEVVEHDHEDRHEDREVEDERYPLGVRLRVILGASVVLWALILWAVGLL